VATHLSKRQIGLHQPLVCRRDEVNFAESVGNFRGRIRAKLPQLTVARVNLDAIARFSGPYGEFGPARLQLDGYFSID
jgi:hypothetical protein